MSVLPIQDKIMEQTMGNFMCCHNKLNSLLREVCMEIDTFTVLKDALGDVIPDKTGESIDDIYSEIIGLERRLRSLRY